MPGTSFKNDYGDGIVEADGFEGPLTGDVTGSVEATAPIGLMSYTVAEANALTNVAEGSMIFVSDGDSGSPCVAIYDGADWLRIALGAAIADS